MKARWLVAIAAAAFLAPVGAIAAGEARTIELAVTKNGFEPARVKVTKGVPLKLVVTRKTDETCAKEIVIPDQKIRAELPLNKPVTLTFTPTRSGEIRYACGMNMITGVLEVASSNGAAPLGAQNMGTDASTGGMQGTLDGSGAVMRQRCSCMSHSDES